MSRNGKTGIAWMDQEKCINFQSNTLCQKQQSGTEAQAASGCYTRVPEFSSFVPSFYSLSRTFEALKKRAFKTIRTLKHSKGQCEP